MPTPLLTRQTQLLAYLTSDEAIFGAAAPRQRALRGIDPAHLRLEARFSHEKRMEKIAGVFSRTLELLGRQQTALVRAFATACPSTEIGRLANARQFHDFLVKRWRRRPPTPRYLVDVAAFERAHAEARRFADGEEATEIASVYCPLPSQRGIRRRPSVTLLQLRHDVRALLETGRRRPAPARRTTSLALVTAPGSADPEILELPPEIYSLLDSLDDWADPALFAGDPALVPVLRELGRRGLIEGRL